MAPFARLIIQTSAQGRQAWVALDDPAAARRLVAGTGADPSASGAGRWPGSRNWKRPDAPVVRVVSYRPGVVAPVAELERCGLLAPPEERPRVPSQVTRRPYAASKPKAWPSYPMELEKHKNGAGKPDSLRADSAWCAIAREWGHDRGAVTAKLPEVSDRARRGGRGYIKQTVAFVFGSA